MRNQLRQFSIYASVSLMVAMGAGMVHAGVVGPQHGGPEATVTITASAITTTKVVNITTGEIDLAGGSGNGGGGCNPCCQLQGNNGSSSTVDDYTALDSIIPLQLFQDLLSDPQLIGGTIQTFDPLTGDPITEVVPPLDPQLIAQLQALEADVASHSGNSSINPSIAEYLLSDSLGTELAYSATTTTIEGSGGGDGGDDRGGGDDRHGDDRDHHGDDGDHHGDDRDHHGDGHGGDGHGGDGHGGGGGGSSTTTQTGVQIPSRVQNIEDLSQIANQSVGGARNVQTTSSQQLGQDLEFTYQLGPVPIGTTTEVTKVGGVNITTKVVSEADITGFVNFQIFEVNGSGSVTPLVLDMTGSGKLEASNGVWLPHPGRFDQPRSRIFDFFNNGFPVAMEWVGPHDGLLVEPKADGSVDGSCLFGTQGGWDSGFQKLSLRDTHHDGKLTGDELNGLYVWVDANQDTRCQPDELKSVQELGISEIRLDHRGYRSTFVMNGQTHKMWDWFPTAVAIKHISKDTALENLRAQQAARAQN